MYLVNILLQQCSYEMFCAMVQLQLVCDGPTARGLTGCRWGGGAALREAVLVSTRKWDVASRNATGIGSDCTPGRSRIYVCMYCRVHAAI